MKAFAMALLCLSTACVGARTQVRANALEVPVSMSPTLLVGDQIFTEQEQTPLAKFHHEKTVVAIVYSHVTPGGALDLSEPINAQVRAADGDAIVNFTVTALDCALNPIMFMTLVLPALPIIPGCVTVHADGDIVKIREKQQRW